MNTTETPERPVVRSIACSALCGTFDIEGIEQAYFNHDNDGAEPAAGQWEKRRDEWRTFKAYLAAHPRQEIPQEMPQPLRKRPWWRKDRLGWPVETFKGKPVKSALRILGQNIRKITG